MTKRKSLQNNMKQMAKEILKIISKKEIEKIARDVGFVQREGKIKAHEFLYLCALSELDVSKYTLVTISTNLSAKVKASVSAQAIDQRLNDKAELYLRFGNLYFIFLM